MASLFASVLEDLFDSDLGLDSVYRPRAGAVINPLRVMSRRPDRVVSFGDSEIKTATAIFDTLVSRLAAPRKGDRIEVGGEVFEVAGSPRREDTHRLIWTLETEPVLVEKAKLG